MPNEKPDGIVVVHQPWRIALALGLVIGGIILLWQAIGVLLLGFAGVLGAVLLCTCADFLGRFAKCNRRSGVLVMVIVIVFGFGWLTWTVVPSLVEQYGDLEDELRAARQIVERWINRNADALPVEDASDVGDQLIGDEIWARVGGIFSTTVGAISAFAIASVVAIFLALDAERYVTGLLRLFPVRRRERMAEVIGAINYTLSRWLVAQLISMSFLAITTWIALTWLGVPLALLLALLTGLMTFIPYFGPLLAGIPIVFVAFSGGPMLALWTGITYLIIQNLESNVLMPYVYQRTVRLPPAVTLTTQVLLGALMGLPGFILATPLAAVGLVSIRMLYVQDVLGDKLEERVEEVDQVEEAPPPP